MIICGALRDLVPVVQFKIREKHPCRSVTFSKIADSPWVFLTFFKLYKWYQILQSIIYILGKIMDIYISNG